MALCSCTCEPELLNATTRTLSGVSPALLGSEWGFADPRSDAVPRLPRKVLLLSRKSVSHLCGFHFARISNIGLCVRAGNSSPPLDCLLNISYQRSFHASQSQIIHQGRAHSSCVVLGGSMLVRNYMKTYLTARCGRQGTMVASIFLECPQCTPRYSTCLHHHHVK